MSVMNDFESGSVRQGFIIDEEPHYHSEVLSLHGFHFELKSAREKPGTYNIHMQVFTIVQVAKTCEAML